MSVHAFPRSKLRVIRVQPTRDSGEVIVPMFTRILDDDECEAEYLRELNRALGEGPQDDLKPSHSYWNEIGFFIGCTMIVAVVLFVVTG